MFEKKILATDPNDECTTCETNSCKTIVNVVQNGSDPELAERLTELEEQVNKLDFLDLTDTPDTYVGQGGRFVAVKDDETGLEFIGTGGDTAIWGGIIGNIEEQTDLIDLFNQKQDIKTKLQGDQDDITEINNMGSINVPFLTDEVIWRANYILAGDTYEIDNSMLQDGVLYGFPNPTTSTFTYKIIYI